MKSLNLALIIISGSIMMSRLIKYYPYSNWSLIIIFIFGFLLIFFSFLFFLNDELRKKILLIFTSTILTIFVINPFLSFFTERYNDDVARVKTAKKEKIFFDSRNKLEVIKDLKKNNPNVYPSITQSGAYKKLGDKLSFLPLSGISESITVHCNEIGEWSIYQSDKYGFNNKKFKFDNISTKRVLIVGDSFAHGACVPQDQTISGWLNKSIDVQSRSLGMEGNGPLAVYASIKEYANYLEPTHIVWILFDNDVGDLNNELKNKFLSKYLQQDFSQNLINKQEKIDTIYKNFVKEGLTEKILIKNKTKNFLDKCLSLYYVRKLLGFTKYKYEAKEIKDFSKLKKIIKLIDKYSQQINSKFFIVYVPNYLHFLNKNDFKRKLSPVVLNIKNLENELNSTKIKWLNFYQVMLESENHLNFYPFKLKGHFTPQGYKTLAKEIQNFLQ